MFTCLHFSHESNYFRKSSDWAKSGQLQFSHESFPTQPSIWLFICTEPQPVCFSWSSVSNPKEPHRHHFRHYLKGISKIAHWPKSTAVTCIFHLWRTTLMRFNLVYDAAFDGRRLYRQYTDSVQLDLELESRRRYSRSSLTQSLTSCCSFSS